MPKNDRRPSRLQFTTADLEAKGFVQLPDGTWSKSSADLDRLDAKKHTEPERALVKKVAKRSRRPRRGAKKNIRDHAPQINVTMIAHLQTRMDGDNLGNALKPVRDEIAKWIGTDDADGRIRWEHGQVETRGTTGVLIRVEEVQR